jgi:hypothetical protein
MPPDSPRGGGPFAGALVTSRYATEEIHLKEATEGGKDRGWRERSSVHTYSIRET